MLPKENRLLTDPQFQTVFHFGYGKSNAFVSLKYKSNQSVTSRFGIIISKKVEKSAVKRNLLKRIARNFIRTNLANFTPGYDFILIVKPSLSGKKSLEIRNALKDLFTSTNLFAVIKKE